MLWRRGTAYSQELRDRVFAHYNAGEAVGEIAEALCGTVSYVSKVLSRRKLTGELSARPQRGHVGPKLAGLHEAIQTEVESWLGKSGQRAYVDFRPERGMIAVNRSGYDETRAPEPQPDF